jgi:hypothetical protein
MCFPDRIQRSVGIELLPKLHSIALRHREAATSLSSAAAAVEFLCEDFIETLPAKPNHSSSALSASTAVSPVQFDWRTSDIVFANATCFDDAMLTVMWKLFEGMRPGAVLIITSHKVLSQLFELVFEVVDMKSSWGTATVRTYRRKALPRWLGNIVGRKIPAGPAPKQAVVATATLPGASGSAGNEVRSGVQAFTANSSSG